jgi:hypothetical protein
MIQYDRRWIEIRLSKFRKPVTIQKPMYIHIILYVLLFLIILWWLL